jgi:hypothetical protein
MQWQAIPGWQINAQAPDGSVLAPGKPITQVLYLLNLNNAPFQLTVKVAYKYGTQPLTESGTITTLPRP